MPEVFGGAERLWRSLASGIEASGDIAEIITLPFPERSLTEVLDGYERFSELDVSRFDVVITGKYPAWMINHPRHLVYLLHPLRGLYDTYPRDLGLLTDTSMGQTIEARLDAASTSAEILEIGRAAIAEVDTDDPLAAYPGPLARSLIHHLDVLAFAPDRVQAFGAISEEVAARAGYLPQDRAVQVVYPVSDLPTSSGDSRAESDEVDLIGPELVGPVFFTASRHDAPKRIDLIIAAFRRLTDGHNDRQLSLLIAGDGPERERLEDLAGGNERIHFLGRVSEDELAYRYANSDVVVFVPDREDFGYISLESMLAGTPVLTTTDSGGANELLSPGVGGLIVDPTEQALADAMDQLADDPYQRWQLGLNGRRRARNVRWAPILATIAQVARTTDRPHIVIVSTFGIDPMVGGGQRRLRHLARALTTHADVTVLALTNHGSADRAIARRVLEPGLTQIDVSRSDAHRRAEEEITRVCGFPVDDITCARLWQATPAFEQELTRLSGVADVVINAHPFLAPAIAHVVGSAETPPVVVYDAHNAEAAFKTGVLRDGATPASATDWLVTLVTDAEATAVRLADYVSACTPDDLQSVLSLVSAHEQPSATAVVGNGVDTHAMARRTPEQYRTARAEALALFDASVSEDRPLAVFVGSWHPPNIEAARLTIALARQRPDWLFGLAGSHTLSFAQATEPDGSSDLPPNVRLLSTFAEESLWPLLAGADVALNLMVSGGGSNLKMFDYLAVGVPVLTTTTGARGLPDPEAVVWVAESQVTELGVVLDQLAENDDERSQRSDRGRTLAETTVDWRDLGHRWATDILRTAGLDGSADTNARTSAPDLPPILATQLPPPTDPSLELMNRLADHAVKTEPPPETITMNPNLRENLRRMKANRHAGQVLPTDARLRLAKSAVLRVGQAITNEQASFNEAALDVVSELSSQVADLTATVEAQATKIAALEADLESEQS